MVFTVQAANVEDYTSQLPAGANLALMVQKIGAPRPLIDYHSQQMALPASTQKVDHGSGSIIAIGPRFQV